MSSVVSAEFETVFEDRPWPVAEVVDLVVARRRRTSVGMSDAWPETAARLRRLLRARGVRTGDVEDIIQEVAVRALERGVTCDSADDLYRWCSVVARNITIDTHRTRRPADVEIDVEHPSALDVSTTVEQRSLIRFVASEISALSRDDHAALMQHAPDGPGTAVRRHRVRKRLRDRVNEAVWGVVGLAGLRRTDRWLRAISSASAIEAVAAVAVAASFGIAAIYPSSPPPASAVDRSSVQIVGPAASQASDALASASKVAVPSPTMAKPGPRRAPSVLPDLPNQRVGAGPAGGDAPSVETRDRTVDDRIVCLADDPVLGDVCTPL